MFKQLLGRFFEIQHLQASPEPTLSKVEVKQVLKHCSSELVSLNSKIKVIMSKLPLIREEHAKLTDKCNARRRRRVGLAIKENLQLLARMQQCQHKLQQMVGHCKDLLKTNEHKPVNVFDLLTSLD